MKKNVCLGLALLLSLCALTAFAAPVDIPEAGISLTLEEGQTLETGEELSRSDAEAGYVAVLRDSDGNRMNITPFVHEDWQKIEDLYALSQNELQQMADWLYFGEGYLRTDLGTTPDVTTFLMGDRVYLGITAHIPEGEIDPESEEEAVYLAEDSVLLVLPEICLHFTFSRTDGKPVEAQAANTLLGALASLEVSSPTAGEEEVPEETTEPAEDAGAEKTKAPGEEAPEEAETEAPAA